MKNVFSKTKEMSEKKRHYFYSFAKLSDVWFIKRWLACPLCLCSQSAVVPYAV